MALNWSVSNVKDYEKLHDDPVEWSITNGIIWATMVVGLNEITDDNVGIWVRRLAISDAVSGTTMLRAEDGGAFVFTEEMIRRRVGLKTNATHYTPAAFFKAMKEQYVRHYR